jgi:hypothetical protein
VTAVSAETNDRYRRPPETTPGDTGAKLVERHGRTGCRGRQVTLSRCPVATRPESGKETSCSRNKTQGIFSLNSKIQNLAHDRNCCHIQHVRREWFEVPPCALLKGLSTQPALHGVRTGVRIRGRVSNYPRNSPTKTWTLTTLLGACGQTLRGRSEM